MYLVEGTVQGQVEGLQWMAQMQYCYSGYLEGLSGSDLPAGSEGAFPEFGSAGGLQGAHSDGKNRSLNAVKE